MIDEHAMDYLTFCTYRHNRKMRGVSAERLLKQPEFTAAMEERYQREIGRDAERERLLPYFQAIFNAYRTALADVNINIPQALHFAMADAQREVGEIRGRALAREFTEGVKADFAEVMLRSDQRDRHEGRPGDFGASACGRSDKAGR